jgi:hypothetical protein
MKPHVQENLMCRYLLGELPESEVNALEQQLLTDDETFEQLREVESDLVEDYVRGRLTPGDRQRFEQHYLASPVHRRRLVVARNLIEKADGLRATAAAGEFSVLSPPRLFERLGRLQLRRGFALAALLFAAIGFWLFLDHWRLRTEMAQLKAESEARLNRQQALDRELAAAQENGEKLKSEIGRLQAERNALAQPPGEAAKGQPPRSAVFSFALSPTLVRSGGDQQLLTIPLKTGEVHLQMNVEPGEARRYQVSLRSEGRQVWGAQALRPQADGGRGAVVTARIPAGKLPFGDYTLRLSAHSPKGELEVVKHYVFRVIRQ